MVDNTKNHIKKSHDYYDDAKASLSINHLIHAPKENTLAGIINALFAQFEQLKESDLNEEGTLVSEIRVIFEEMTSLMLKIQEHGDKGIPADTFVVLSFRLGIEIGRQEGLGYLAPLVRRLSELIVEEVESTNAGRIKGGEATNKKFSYPKRLAKEIIPQYAIKYPKRLNYDVIARGVKADIRQLMVNEFELDIYKKETGFDKIPTEQTLNTRINEALTELNYQ